MLGFERNDVESLRGKKTFNANLSMLAGEWRCLEEQMDGVGVQLHDARHTSTANPRNFLAAALSSETWSMSSKCILSLRLEGSVGGDRGEEVGDSSTSPLLLLSELPPRYLFLLESSSLSSSVSSLYLTLRFVHVRRVSPRGDWGFRRSVRWCSAARPLRVDRAIVQSNNGEWGKLLAIGIYGYLVCQ